jgi:hypothetical protein
MPINCSQLDQAKFFIEGKMAPNLWVSIGQISPKLLEFDSGFSSIEEANFARRKVKNYLKVYDPINKVPIRIVKL